MRCVPIENSEPALPSSLRNVRDFARALSHALAPLRRELVRFVDHDEYWMPEPLRSFSERFEEALGEHFAVVLLHLEEIHDQRELMLERLVGHQFGGRGIGRDVPALPCDHEVEVLAERHEVALAVEHDHLHLAIELLDDPAEGVRLPAP
jgi:hypothetical protein